MSELGRTPVADRPADGAPAVAGQDGRRHAQTDRVLDTGAASSEASARHGARYASALDTGQEPARDGAGQATARDGADVVTAGERPNTFTADDLPFDPDNPVTKAGHLLRQDGVDQWHAVGDDHGTRRHRDTGKLIDNATGRYIADNNKVPIAEGVYKAIPDHSTKVSYEPIGDSRGARFVTKAVGERQEALRERDDAWKTFGPKVQELHDSGLIDAHVDKRGNVLIGNISRRSVQEFATSLSGQEAVNFVREGSAFVDSQLNLRVKSEQLGTAGALLFIEQHFDDATIVTPDFETPEDRAAASPDEQLSQERGTPNNFDSLVVSRRTVDEGGDPVTVLSIIEAKGPAGQLATSKVDSPHGPGLPQHEAEQGSTEYIAQKLKVETKLGAHARAAAAEGADPRLAEVAGDLVGAVRSGNMESWVVRTDVAGKVTAFQTVIDTERLRNVPINGLSSGTPNEGETS